MKNFIYDYLAAQGRNGDSELRNVNGELSHVNTREARAIDDYGVLGELLTKEIGAGTNNPSTGLTEYYEGDYGEMDWGEYTDLDPSQFIGMSEEERLKLAQNLGYSGTTQEDMDRYQIGDYDPTAEDRVMEDVALGISDIGEGAQGTLQKAMQAEANMKASQGFEQTGNPQIDAQRQNIFSGITKAIDRGWDGAQRSIHDIREKAMQQFGERVIGMESAVDAPTAPKEKGFFTKAWDSTIGKLGKGIGKLFSDERLKENIQFQHVDNIGMPVYTYNYTYDKGSPQIGYMAQDVEKIYPEAISNSQGFKKVDYSKIIERAKSIGRR
tara:strand:- start:2207 stop:3181 length:975 start_codon:yes stop_codon:yes gene_type:complete